MRSKTYNVLKRKDYIMEMIECPFCSEKIKVGTIKCEYCDSILTSINMNSNASQISTSKKSKIVAILLALLLGGIGAHKFYVGSWGWGIVYIVLFVCIPFLSLFVFVEIIRYLTLSSDEFKHKVASLHGPFSFLW